MISYKKFDGYYPFKYRTDFSLLKNMCMFPNIILTDCWSPIVWKNNQAKTENFLYSDFLALDFDQPGEETIETINHSLQDHRRIIATTKSHQVLKKNITCDRYRLIIPFTERITNYSDYRHTYQQALKKYDWADKSCLDGARFFYPSKNIFVIDRESEYSWEVSKQPVTSVTEEIKTPTGRIPLWCLDFINHGVVKCESRNMKVFAVARELFFQGFSENDVRRILLRSPIKWDGVSLESTIKSARNKTV